MLNIFTFNFQQFIIEDIWSSETLFMFICFIANLISA